MYYIGVDIGTTSTKSLVFDKTGSIISKAIKEYPTNSPRPGYKEQDPSEILEAIIETLRESIALAKIKVENIAFVAFSSMMHSIIAVDEKGQELCPSIIWSDNRSNKYVKQLRLTGKAKALYLKTGTPPHPMSPFYKLLWLKDFQPEIFEKAHKFVSIKEYIFYHFFGEFLVDYSIASATGIFNIFDLSWDKEALNILGIDESRLSKLVPTTHIIDGLKEALCTRTGLNSNTKFVIGASDGCLANLGSQTINSTNASITIGTSGAVRVIHDKPITDNNERTFCYYLSDNRYVIGGAANSGGVVYQWFKDNFGELEIERAKAMGVSPYSLINEKIHETPAGSGGLIFLPFLSGERAPYWNSNLRGSFIGISDFHGKNHFARAVLEGICYALKDIFEAVQNSTGEIKHISASGGFSRSEDWVQILCDVLGKPVTISENYESSCIGAVILGKEAISETAGISDDHGKSFKVQEANREVYARLYTIYKNSIAVLTPMLEQLSNHQNLYNT